MSIPVDPAGDRYLYPPEHPKFDAPPLARRFEASETGILVDGAPVPWQLLRTPLQVERLIGPSGAPLHVVFLPVLIDGPVLSGPGVDEKTMDEILAEQDTAEQGRDRDEC